MILSNDNTIINQPPLKTSNSMTSQELKELVKAHFSLVEATTEETFGELKDINGAFTLRFPGDSLQVGDKVEVITAEGQVMDAPDGEHELEDGTKIRTENSMVTEIMSASGEMEMAEVETEVEGETKEDVAVEDASMADMMEDKVEVGMPAEAIVSAIVEAVKSEVEAMKKEMAELKEKMAEYATQPASEKSMPASFKSALSPAPLNVLNQDRFNKINELISKTKIKK